MLMKSMSLRCLGLAALVAVAGCAPPMANVKDVLADKDAYLTSHFSPTDIPGDVRQTVLAADNGPLGFRKMTFHLTWHLNDDNKTRATTGQQTVTLINAGGSLVQELVEDSRNGVPTDQVYSLSYRALVALKAQKLFVGSTTTGLPIVVKSFGHFDPIADHTGGLEYRFKAGLPLQLMNFVDGRRSCVPGSIYPASKFDASLDGEAQDLVCSDYNKNGVFTGKRRFVWLKKYGVGLFVHTQVASGMSDATVDSVVIE